VKKCVSELEKLVRSKKNARKATSVLINVKKFLSPHCLYRGKKFDKQSLGNYHLIESSIHSIEFQNKS